MQAPREQCPALWARDHSSFTELRGRAMEDPAGGLTLSANGHVAQDKQGPRHRHKEATEILLHTCIPGEMTRWMLWDNSGNNDPLMKKEQETTGSTGRFPSPRSQGVGAGGHRAAGSDLRRARTCSDSVEPI